ncbi:MAG TPA: CDP-2,3-bis-(O-geranylgeranyl)-sn-glycerol synthase [Candidatus Syntrophoarchaeum butanivorans]|uniref:CDP-archaeol synthase n=1 Tax=Candidatus Syntropharchaeum butanivorans TaxID=1839936 RepID=A0A7C1BAB0_9EURY|nr:MAG: CDP-2,3-bis-(O-geranylgeranyl)-sn-glycerol synthase [Candidatus Bathyarchaeota archaeon]HDM36342.1 CDP-2,3-bis-(O-geranylgeranyl)-sn-glycerol synthase [Candidatus Syntrophoarchaeum butanivorans]
MLESVLIILPKALWLILPAYVANSSAVLFGGGVPIDLRVKIRGKRILGDGKTYRGLILGTCCGVLVGIFQNQMAGLLGGVIFPPVVLLSLAFGALFGDITESLIKRRLGIKQGAPFFPFDQLDFIAGAFITLWLTSEEWFLTHFSLDVIITILIITPVLHLLTNRIGYIIGKKDVPW